LRVTYQTLLYHIIECVPYGTVLRIFTNDLQELQKNKRTKTNFNNKIRRPKSPLFMEEKEIRRESRQDPSEEMLSWWLL